MKIKLINPGWMEKSLWGVHAFKFPPLQLATIASLTPNEIDMEIIDENVNPINFNDDADLIAISAMTALAPRAYQIADTFRERGIKVVLGGIHPSTLPNEALQHADSVLIGEAEYTWTKLIMDYKKSKLKKIYPYEKKVSLENLPLPRRDLYKKGKYFTENTLQISRGCPFDCNFCSVTEFFGKTYRFKPINDIIQEIESLKGRDFFFVDDNIIGNLNYAEQLFKALKPLNINWVSQAPITFGKNNDFLKLAADSGCKAVFIGFESLSSINLKQSGKFQNKVEHYNEYIKKIHEHGIAIQGAFIFGFDNDDKNVFRNIIEFSYNNDLESCQFTILTPFPGTRLYSELESQNRILHHDWSKYDCANVVFKPKNLTAEELQEGFEWSYYEFNSYYSIISRLLKSRRYLKFFLPLNFGFRKIIHSHLTYNKIY